MKKPGEQGFTWDEDTYADTDDFIVVEEKTSPQKDGRTVKDDLQDYIYMNPVRKKKKKKGKSKRSPRHKSQQIKKMKTWKKVLLIIVSIVLTLTIVMAGTIAFLLIKGQNELFEDDIMISAPENLDAKVQENGDYIVYNGATYKYNDDVTTMLFMGVDKRDMDDIGELGAGGQADVIIVMALDFKNRRATMINVPRDTMTDVAVYSVSGYYTGMVRQQICLAYAYGDGKETSCTNTVASVKRVFYNIPISTYYALDLDGIAPINDAVGGVDVESPETIEKFTKGEHYHLMGKDAERFVKARVSDRPDANILRNERQKVYARSFMDKVITGIKSDPGTAVDLFNESSPYSCTNLDAAKVMYLAKEVALEGSLDSSIVSVPGESKLNANDQAEYIVDEKAFYEQFLSVFYEKM